MQDREASTVVCVLIKRCLRLRHRLKLHHTYEELNDRCLRMDTLNAGLEEAVQSKATLQAAVDHAELLLNKQAVSLLLEIRKGRHSRSSCKKANQLLGRGGVPEVLPEGDEDFAAASSQGAGGGGGPSGERRAAPRRAAGGAADARHGAGGEAAAVAPQDLQALPGGWRVCVLFHLLF